MPLQDAAAAAKRASQAPPPRERAGTQLANLKSPKSPSLDAPAPRSPSGSRGSAFGDQRRGSGGQPTTPSDLLGNPSRDPRKSVGFPQGGRQSPIPSPTTTGQSPTGRKRRESQFKKEDESTNNVKVFLRVRPFNEREIRIHEEHSDSMLRSIIDMPDGPYGQVHFLEKSRNEEDDEDEYHLSEIFDFDRCLWSIYPEQQPYDHEFCAQENLFDIMGAPALENAWKGFNTCIFAYGQTGAGKTHTMMGHFSADSGVIHGNPGVIPLLCKNLYQSIAAKEEEEAGKERKVLETKFETELCAYEIYNERVRDLFFTHTPGRKAKDELKVRKHPLDGPFVDGISKLTPHTWQECIADIEAGNAQRTTGATAMNSESSRSHSVFQIKFTQVETSIPQERYEKPVTNRKYSVINLIDLAGSERNKKSQAAGERLIEATNINLSLTTLKRVIDALVYNSQNPKAPKQIPYRDSVLTMLLSHSLGGNSKTMMVACVSPHYDNAEETLNTLRYASQARRIVNIVRVNEDSKAKANLMLKEEIAKLQEELEHRRTGDYTPKQLEELEDEIRAGQEALSSYEEEAKRLRQEKEDEIGKRYQQAFQHSFQMVVMRKQKEQAQLQAAAAQQMKEENMRSQSKLEQMKRENSTLRHVRDESRQKELELLSELEKRKAKQDEILIKAYGLQWVEKQRRILAERKVDSSEKAHKLELDAIIESAAQEYENLNDAHKNKREECELLLRQLEDANIRLTRVEQEGRTTNAKAEEYKERIQRVEAAHERQLKDTEYRSRSDLEAAKSKLNAEIQCLKSELEDVVARSLASEDSLRKENTEKAEILEYRLKRDLQKAKEDAESRRRDDSIRMQEEMTKLRGEHYDNIKTLKEHHQKDLDEQQAKYEALLQEYKEKIDDQITVLNDVQRRELKYRDLAHQLDSALERTPGGASPDLREFLELARSYSAELVSNPINRAAVARAAMAVTAFVSKAPPCVGLNFSEDTGSPQAALNGSVKESSPGPRTRTSSRSPSRRISRRTKGSPGSPKSPSALSPRR